MSTDDTRSDAAAGPAVPEGSHLAYDAFISYAHDADEVFAPVLQRGLQHLAKPWNRRRVMEVFRDETSLAASPGLWPSIRDALDASRWFILLASPEAARSRWVGQEIEHWVSSRGTDHLLVAVTDGIWAWDDDTGDLSLTSTAVNPALRGVLPAEPKYVDMTWARRDTGLTLRNARFRDQIATLAAAIRGVPKEDIEGEDVRQQRRTRRIVRAVIAALTVLVVLASVLAVVANIQRRQAVYQQQQAVYQRDVAISGELSSQSEIMADTNPAVSKLLSITAWDINRSSNARYAMLAAAARPGIAVLTGHQYPVTSVAFSPVGKVLASGSEDGTVRLWDVATHRQSGAPLDSHQGLVYSVAFSPDGKALASRGDDGTVRLWDVATRRQIGVPFTSRPRAVSPVGSSSSVAFSPDGKALAIGDDDGTARLWEVATHHQIGSYPTGGKRTLLLVAFSPDGKTLVTGRGDNGQVRLWDVATRHQIGVLLDSHVGGRVNSLAFSPDGKTVAIGGDNTVRLWGITIHRWAGTPFTGTGLATRVAFSPDGKTLATGGYDHAIRLWNLSAPHPTVPVANYSGQIGSPLAGHTGPVNSVAFSPDGKTLASGSDDGTVRLWDMATSYQVGAPLLGYADPDGGSVVFSPDGKTLATGGSDGTVRLWDAATRRQIGAPFTGGSDNISSVAFSPDGKTLASGGIRGVVRLWDAATRRQIGTPFAETPVNSVAFSPDGKTLATGSFDGTVRLWGVATRRQIGSPLVAVSDIAEEVNSVAFSPDGKALASGGGDGTVRLWDVATRQQIGAPFTGNSRIVYSVAFSPDGKTLASGGDDGTVRIWDVATHQQAGVPFISQSDTVNSVAFSPDSRTLASAGHDGTVRLWDVATHQQIGNPLSGHTGPVNSVAFSPDGKTLASSSEDATVRLWNVGYLTATAAYLCASVKESLTHAEWARYVPPGPAYQSVCPVTPKQ
jgi:WD40 repeat protein